MSVTIKKMWSLKGTTPTPPLNVLNAVGETFRPLGPSLRCPHQRGSAVINWSQWYFVILNAKTHPWAPLARTGRCVYWTEPLPSNREWWLERCLLGGLVKVCVQRLGPTKIGIQCKFPFSFRRLTVQQGNHARARGDATRRRKWKIQQFSRSLASLYLKQKKKKYNNKNKNKGLLTV